MRYPTSPQEFNSQYPDYQSGLRVILTNEREINILYVPAQGEPIQELMRLWVYVNGYRAVVESFDV